jgi:major vault protein
LFKVKDFVGNACKTIASRIRGAVSGTSYEDFHKQAAPIIQGAVFGRTKENKVRERLKFQANNLVITNVDIQSQEPEDAETRKLLKDSYHQTIEFNKNATEDQ